MYLCILHLVDIVLIMANQDIKFIDLFAGLGGFHVALSQLGCKCVFASEWDKNARISYENNFREISPSLFQKDVDGNYYINNLYCSFNFARVEQEMDPEIYAAVVRYEQQEDVIELLQETQDKFDEAVEKDEALSTMITETIPNAMKQWLQTVVSLPQDDVSETETQETEIPATEVTEETETEEESEEAEEIVEEVPVQESESLHDVIEEENTVTETEAPFMTGGDSDE